MSAPLASPGSTPLGDIEALAWISRNSPNLRFDLEFDETTPIITLAGDRVALSGRVSSKDLATAITTAGDPSPSLIPLIAFRAEGRAAQLAAKPGFEAHVQEIQASIPAVLDWIRSATIMAAALEYDSPSAFASRSSPLEPGLVYLSLGGDLMQTLEGLVHETAHLYLFMAEKEAALVECGDARFKSPLRAEPRPLRGVLLAMHACAYISAAFAEAEAAGLEHPGRCRAQRLETLAMFEEARAVVEGAGDLLTQAGARFVAGTMNLAEYASGRPQAAEA
jgi:HEXXH motif-containing protein